MALETCSAPKFTCFTDHQPPVENSAFDHVCSYRVNADALVNLLLELNVINVKDIDIEINKLAAKISDPRAQKWFRRVPRFFLINIDRLLAEPYVAKAEPRGLGSSKYYADPRGGWLKGREPEHQAGSPLPVREQYDPKKQTYTTALHTPAVQRDIEQSFTKFNPQKAKAKGVYGAPPTKDKLQPWMTQPDAKEKEFYHFDPIQTRRRELFDRYLGLVHYLNYQHSLIAKAKSGQIDANEAERAEQAEKLMRRLEVMKTDDVESFRDVLKEAADFRQLATEKPWLYTKDGRIIAANGDFTLRKVVYVQTANAMARRPVDLDKWTRITDLYCPVHQKMYCSHEGPRWPVWCTKSESYANSYLKDGPLYHVDKNDYPYALVHFPTSQVANPYNQTVDVEDADLIAPLFADERLFSAEELARTNVLNSAVARLRNQQR